MARCTTFATRYQLQGPWWERLVGACYGPRDAFADDVRRDGNTNPFDVTLRLSGQRAYDAHFNDLTPVPASEDALHLHVRATAPQLARVIEILDSRATVLAQALAAAAIGEPAVEVIVLDDGDSDEGSAPSPPAGQLPRRRRPTQPGNADPADAPTAAAAAETDAADLDSSSEDEDDTACAGCGDMAADGPRGSMLLCDICPIGWHLSCLTPPLLAVPEGDWACPQCTATAAAGGGAEPRVLNSAALPSGSAAASAMPRVCMVCDFTASANHSLALHVREEWATHRAAYSDPAAAATLPARWRCPGEGCGKLWSKRPPGLSPCCAGVNLVAIALKPGPRGGQTAAAGTPARRVHFSPPAAGATATPPRGRSSGAASPGGRGGSASPGRRRDGAGAAADLRLGTSGGGLDYSGVLLAFDRANLANLRAIFESEWPPVLEVLPKSLREGICDAIAYFVAVYQQHKSASAYLALLTMLKLVFFNPSTGQKHEQTLRAILEKRLRMWREGDLTGLISEARRIYREKHAGRDSRARHADAE